MRKPVPSFLEHAFRYVREEGLSKRCSPYTGISPREWSRTDSAHIPVE